MPRPRTATLSPYTTLFRSQLVGDVQLGRVHLALLDRDAAPPCWAWPRSAASRSRRDRKSTRLNSRHMSISYAGFCLRKEEVAFAYRAADVFERLSRRVVVG